jgi:spore germination protein
MCAKSLRAATAALLTLLGLGAAACGTARQMPAAAPLRVLVFYDPQLTPASGPLLSLLAANRSAIWVLAPMWLAVQADGSVTDRSQAPVASFARQNHIQLMPLVVNAGATSAFLLHAGACTAGPCANAVANLAAIVKKNNYDGLNIDFEQLRTGARAGLVAFVNQLHLRLRAMGKPLTVDVIPAGSRRQADGPYNFPALARDSDDIVLMTYDHHDDTSKPGAIAPMSWVRKSVNEALHLGVAPSHLVLGLADYGYDWTVPGGHGKTIGLKQVDALIAREHITVSRTADGSPHFAYAGGKHVVWYEDQVSILPKIRLARQDHLEALALWTAGYETPAYWNALRAAAAGQTPPASRSSAAPASGSAAAGHSSTSAANPGSSRAAAPSSASQGARTSSGSAPAAA